MLPPTDRHREDGVGDEFIDLNKPSQVPPVETDPDLFAPSAPTEAIFHTRDLPPAETFCEPTKLSLEQKLEQADQLPVRSGPEIYRGLRWVSRPVTWIVAIILVLLIMGHVSWWIGRWLVLGILAFVTSYSIYPRNAFRRRYNMDWEADADPTGCFNRWYWFWW